MNAIQYVAPTIEPITLAELKLHLRLDSGTFAGNVASHQSLPPMQRDVANNYTTYAGAGVEVLGKRAVVFVESGTNDAGATLDVKIQESDDNVTYTDWASGAFTQITVANDNATYEKEYTGTRRYIRTVAKVLVEHATFGTSILVEDAITAEDDILTSLIQASREIVEIHTHRQLLTATWDLYLDEWPEDDDILLPFGNLQNASGTAPIISWKDADGTETILTVTTDYIVCVNSDGGYGRIVLPYESFWPDGDLYPVNPIKIRFVCGWTSAALVPACIKSAMKMICGDLYENRESQLLTTSSQSYIPNKTVSILLAGKTLWREF